MVPLDQVMLEIRHLLAELCELPAAQISADGVLRGYGMSSTNAVELIAKLERRYEVELELEEVSRVETLRELASYVQTLTAGPGQPS
jgi:acyl carrier protein